MKNSNSNIPTKAERNHLLECAKRRLCNNMVTFDPDLFDWLFSTKGCITSVFGLLRNVGDSQILESLAYDGTDGTI